MSYTICSRFKGEHIVYAGYTICTSREHIVYGAFCGSTELVWPRKYAHSSFSSLVQSLLPKDTLLRTYRDTSMFLKVSAWPRKIPGM